MSDRKAIPLTFALSSSNPRRRCGTIEEIFEWLRNAEFVAIGLEAPTVEIGFVIADR